MGLPEGWNDYNRVGNQVHGTRFIAFKVPLKESMNRGSNVSDEKQLYPKLLVQLIPNLGLIIDLTNTTKYYHPDEFHQLGVQYEKIKVEGRQIPNPECSRLFRDRVNEFLEENADNDKLIGVHCTHGLNRSGFLICRYMIEEMKTPPLDAISAFEMARGHKMERENYIMKLTNLTAKEGKTKIPKLPSLAIDTETDKGTQTTRGYWIPDHAVSGNRSISQPAEASNQIQKQVQLVGCANIKRSDLIPDGRGGYFVHINSRDIQRKESTPPNRGQRSNLKKRSLQQNSPYTQRHPPHPKAPHTQRPRYGDGQGFQMPEEIYRDRRGDRPRYNESLPNGNNNLAEDLLRMNQFDASNGHRKRWGPHTRPNQHF